MSKKDAQTKKSAITEMETDKPQQSTPRTQSTGRTVKPSLRDYDGHFLKQASRTKHHIVIKGQPVHYKLRGLEPSIREAATRRDHTTQRVSICQPDRTTRNPT
ncbi:hypothetical protein Ciccas_012237 [Cichlidogyrus casuarinus]|uniref:Uncharacterized protein n=1 Tax=Cichlidogyrus casuarinus TaxID=1844966 RepID=A0ABD2PQS2_9PLAT